MKANELRLGNFVYAFRSVWTIDNSDFANLEAIETYDFIPLTEEWILKAGFIHKNGYGRIHSKLKGNIFISECRAYYVYQYYDIRIELRYVHELQNLWFSLCGEELVFSTTEP